MCLTKKILYYKLLAHLFFWDLSHSMSLVNHILESSLYVSNIDRAEQFYANLFDIKTFSRDGDRHVFFKIGDSMLLIFNVNESKKNGTVPSHGAVGESHLAFTVEHKSLDFWRKRLKAQEVEIEQEYEWPSGGKSIYFRDPFQNSIELATSDIWF